MTQRILALLLVLFAGCAPQDLVLVDAEFDGDAEVTGDVLGEEDGGSPTGDARVDVADVDASSIDADGGSATVTDSGTIDGGGGSGSAVCGDGFIDSPETCDPSYEGGSHSSIACEDVGDFACRWCPMGAVGAYCVYGDYERDARSPGWSSACSSSARNTLHWVTWHDAAGRDAVLDAYRQIHTIGGGSTDVSGWIGLHADEDRSQFRWVDDDSLIAPAILPPIRNSRSAGLNCLTLYVTDDDAYLMYSVCTGSENGLCFTERWGVSR